MPTRQTCSQRDAHETNVGILRILRGCDFGRDYLTFMLDLKFQPTGFNSQRRVRPCTLRSFLRKKIVWIIYAMLECRQSSASFQASQGSKCRYSFDKTLHKVFLIANRFMAAGFQKAWWNKHRGEIDVLSYIIEYSVPPSHTSSFF